MDASGLDNSSSSTSTKKITKKKTAPFRGQSFELNDSIEDSLHEADSWNSKDADFLEHEI